ncbi:unnamed protein product, partial [Polarella glacialis]
ESGQRGAEEGHRGDRSPKRDSSFAGGMRIPIEDSGRACMGAGPVELGAKRARNNNDNNKYNNNHDNNKKSRP